MESATSKSPGQILLNNYIVPKGISTREFSAMSGIQQSNLRKILKGGRMTHDEITRISTVTRTAPRYWYYLQVSWLFDKYLESRKGSRAIEPISLPWRSYSESPGQILSREFIKPCGESSRSIERKYRIQYPKLYEVVSGKRRITPLLSAQLDAAFGTSTRYWLDLQMSWEIKKIMDACSPDCKSISSSLQEFNSGLELRKFDNDRYQKRPIHPGKILFIEFIKPSKIGINEWGKILFVLTTELKLILSGRRELSPKMIIKLSLLFNTGIVFWIDLNNKYYSWLAEAQCRKLLRGEAREPIHFKDRPMAPFEFLESNFLRPMGFPLKSLLRHVGIKGGYGDDLRVIPRINFDLALKVGQALRLDPLIFIFAQIEYHLHLRHVFRGKKPVHRNFLP